jgi:hypothetical protein
LTASHERLRAEKDCPHALSPSSQRHETQVHELE